MAKYLDYEGLQTLWSKIKTKFAQKSFSKITVGSTTVEADSTADTLTIAAGTNISLSGDATNDKITISAAKTGLKVGASATATANATATNGSVYLNALDGSTVRDSHKIVGSGATTVTSDSSGNITVKSVNTTYSAATTTTNGLMSAADKTKLDGIDEGANNYTLPSAGTSLGGVKSGGVATISNGQITAISKATEATKTTNSLTLQGNGTTAGTFNGSAATTVNIKGGGRTTVSGASGAITVSTSLSNLTVGSKTYNGSAAVSISAADLGLSSAMKFLGTSSTALTDDATTSPITVGETSITPTAGNVVLYGQREFVWTGSKWEELGNEGSYKIVQAAVSSPSASGNATAFIDTISQDTNGKITATKKNVTFPTLSGGSAAAADATVAGGVTVSGHAVSVAKKTLTAGSNVTITGAADKITIAAKDTTYSTMGAATSSAAGTSGLVPAPAAGKQSSFLRGDGTWVVPTNTTYSDMTGATSSAAGTHGLVPAPAAGNQSKYLRGDGTWATPTNTTYSVATTTANGLMSASDKAALDALTETGNSYVLPAATSSTLGGVKIGSNITNSEGTISITKSNVTSALGYTPPTTNTTYSAATTSTAGLMSASDKSKLDGITSSADSVAFSQSLTSGTQVGTITINGTATKLYAPTNTNTHYTTGLKVGASATATANAAASNGSVYLNVLDDTTVRDSHKITGSGATTVTSDANGVITISSTNTTYSALKNPNAVTIQANGTSLGTYDGSAAKTFNLTYSNVGAAAASHTHNYAGSSSAGGAATSAAKLNTNAGTATKPVYFSGGIPVVCTDVDLNITADELAAILV